MEPLRVTLVEGEYRVVLPPEAMEALRLKVGDAVTVRLAGPRAAVRYVGVEEALAAYRESEAENREAMKALAQYDIGEPVPRPAQRDCFGFSE